MKRTLYLISILFLAFIVFEFYLYHRHKDSGFIFLQNETSLTGQDFDVGVSVNGKLVFNTKISRNESIHYDVKTKNKLGGNTIELTSVELGIHETRKVNIFPVNFFVISIYEKTVEIEKYYFPPLLQ